MNEFRAIAAPRPKPIVRKKREAWSPAMVRALPFPLPPVPALTQACVCVGAGGAVMEQCHSFFTSLVSACRQLDRQKSQATPQIRRWP